MAPSLRTCFTVSALVGSLLLTSGTQAADRPAPKTIGTVVLTQPLPFEPKELLEIFTNLSLNESEDKKRITLRHWLGGDVFTFIRSEDGKIYKFSSPLETNEPRLCEALVEMKTKKPQIFNYLEKQFKATENCRAPQAAPVYN